MSIDYQALPLPKPEPRKRVKARKQREDAKRLQAFRDAVWAREQHGVYPDQWGACQRCGGFVIRTSSLDWNRGEVHHIIPRSRCTKADRYNPANGTLVCRPCHRLLQEHRA